MTGQTPQAAMLAHIVSRVQSDVDFLVSQDYISRIDANQFLAKLPDNSTPAAPAPVRRPAVPTTPQAVQARAIWGYNENNSEPNDLSFAPGDTIEIVEETNADWWTGKVKGKQGLFPSNYVEKGTTTTPAPTNGKTPYRPFGAAYHGMDNPPPPGQGVNSVGLQEKDDSQKKSKYSGLKNNMANSAASGAGFGAGAAIGGGLVRAIF
ncbi:hypothetical protein APHAL10511_007417 [Amanita phalloides]|nr:hypothetical protein APHAL10511_007417 [Amanita phalloides]